MRGFKTTQKPRPTKLALTKKEEPLEKALIYRHLAEAAVALGLQDWESYFTQAIQESTGRGRGITRNLYAVALDNQGREVAARSEYLLAVQDLRGDDHWLADTWGGFFSQFLWADLLRQEGDLQAAQEMIERADERQFKRWQNTGLLFPEVYAMRGVVNSQATRVAGAGQFGRPGVGLDARRRAAAAVYPP